MAREDIGRQVPKQHTLSEASGRCPPSSPPPDHQGATSPAAQATGVSGEVKPGSPVVERWGRWTHSERQTVTRVGDLEVAGKWFCGEVKLLPESHHDVAVKQGLKFLGLCDPEPADKPAAKPAVELVGDHEYWTHDLSVPVERIGDVVVGGQHPTKWWCGEKKILPRALHETALKMGLRYLGPAD